ncbi:MAG: hypothetical protein IJA07_04675 [Agathobacter sp.]|nr:hypothetical protein [Agathobacter sp.]
MKKLKKETIRHILPLLIIFWGVASLFLMVGISDSATVADGPTPLEEVDFSGDIDGLYVTGTIYYIYDCYCEVTEEEIVTRREYLIDANDYYYMALRADDSDIQAADTLLDASYSYYLGEDDGTKLVAAQYEITGVIEKIPDSTLEYYHDYIEWDTLDDASKETFLPYYIRVTDYESDAATSLVISIIFFICGGIFLAMALAGFYQRTVKKYIKASPSPELAKQKVDNFVENTPIVNGMRCNNEFILGNNIGVTIFGETSKVAWVYLHTTTHRILFIPIYKNYNIYFGFADGTLQASATKNKKTAAATLEMLQQYCTKAVFGYTPELAQMFRKNREEFLNIKYNSPEEVVE